MEAWLAAAAEAHHGGMDALLGLLLILAVGLPVVIILHSLRVSALVAYLVMGFIAGPSVLGFIELGQIELVAEIGASLLLFSLGLELDLPAMKRQLKQIAIGAGVQVGLTLLVGTLLLWPFVVYSPSAGGGTWGESFGPAFAIGACLTLSSTLMVLRALDERQMRNRPEGRTVLGLLLTQDFSLAPLLFLVALFLGTGGHPWWWLTMGLILSLGLTVVLRAFLATRLWRWMTATHLPELEVAFSIMIALGAAFLTHSFGLGMGVGAFLAGLALGGDEHRHAIETSTRPMQGLFAIMFFASIGLQFDPFFVINNILLVVVALLVSVVIKAFLAGLAFKLSGMDLKTAIGCGIMVGQIGEFSFVISGIAYQGGTGAISSDLYHLVIAVACLSLAATPLLVSMAGRFLPKSVLDSITDRGSSIVVAGLGPVGNTVVETLIHLGQHVFLVDRNPRLLAPWEGNDHAIAHQGRIEDMEDWLSVLGERPAAVVLTFPVADTSALVTERLRRADPTLLVIARCPYQSQVAMLHQAGCQHVICDETETASALVPVLREALGTKHPITELVLPAASDGDRKRTVSSLPALERAQPAAPDAVPQTPDETPSDDDPRPWAVP